MNRIKLERGSRRDDAEYVRSPADVAERARAAADAHQARIVDRVDAEDSTRPDPAHAAEELGEELVSLVEAAVEEELSRLYRQRVASHPASLHLAELHAKLKELAGEPEPSESEHPDAA